MDLPGTSPHPAGLASGDGDEAAERLRLALSVGGLGAWDWDIVSGKISWSEEHFRLQGYQRGEMTPSYEAWLARVHPDDRAEAERKIAESRDRHEPYRHEYRSLRPDGTVRWLQAEGRFFYEHGQPVRMVGVVRDVTERKLESARQAFLLKLADALRRLSEPAEIKATAVRLLGEHLGLNRTFYADAHQGHWLVAKGFEEGVELLPDAPFPMARYGQWIIEELSAGRALVVSDMAADARFAAPEREAHLALQVGAEVAVPLVKGGALLAILVVQAAAPHAWSESELRLIAETAERTWAAVERGQSEAALRRSEARLRGAFSISTVAVLFWREQSVLTDVNDAFLRITGFTREEALGKTWLELTPREFHAISYDALAQLKNGECDPFEKQYYRKDGSRWWGLFTAKVLGEEVVEFVIDITERKRAQAAVREKEERLEAANARLQQQLAELAAARERIAEGRAAAQNLMEDALHAREESERRGVAMHESELRLRTLADVVPQIIWSNSADGHANYFNRRWYEYSGLSYEESAGLGWQAIVHPDDAPRSIPAWKAALSAGEVFDTEYRLRSRDGRYRWFIGRNVPMLDPDGRVIGWFGTATDIQELKEAEAALRANEEQFRRAIEDAPIPVIMHAEDGQVLQISKTWTELTGYRAEDMPSFDAWLNRAYGEGANEVREHVHRLFRGDERLLDAEVELTTADGRRRRWSFSASAPGTLRDGRRFIVGMALDITERKQVEEALRESQERVRLIVENAREYAIFSLDLERRITSWNTGAQSILGHSQEEALGRSGDMIFTPEDLAAGAAEQEARKALAEGCAADERWHVRKDGSRFWGSGMMTAMHDAQGQAIGFVKIFRDQTEELRAKERLERSRHELWEALQQTEQARADAEAARAQAEAAGEAKDHFLAVLSHELRTPLTPIAMAAQTLARRKDLPAPVLEALAMIRRNIQLESRMVDDLLDVTRIERGKMALLQDAAEMHQVIRRAVETTQPEIEAKHQRLTVSLEARFDALQGDAGRLQQVIWNLLRNASKFTPDGGQIAIRTRNEPGLLLVEVSDTGIGLEADALPRIFESFAQADPTITRRFGGLGLGLAIARAIVAAHGGELQVASAGLGHGATFTVTLPLTVSEPGTTSG